MLSNLSSREYTFHGDAYISDTLVKPMPLEAGPASATTDRLHTSLLTLLQPIMGYTRAARAELHALGQCMAAEAPRKERNTFVYGEEGSGRMLSVAPRLQNAPQPIAHTLSLPYGRRSIGTLILTFAEASSLREFEPQAEALAREVALQVVRHDLRYRARRALDLDVILAGTSAALRNLEAQIEKVSAVPYPAVLEGEFGSNPLAIAAAIHLASSSEDRPFIALDCAYRNAERFCEELEAAYRMAAGGTLFLRGVDLLEAGPQRDLLRMLRQGSSALTQRQVVRLIASTPRALESLVEENGFCRLLKTELDYLRISIPPLRDRREDIPQLLEEMFYERSLDGAHKHLSEAATSACQRYDWPENESELERTATRLVVMTEDSLISLQQLRNTVSWVIDEPQVAETTPPLKTGLETYALDEPTLEFIMEPESPAPDRKSAPCLYDEAAPLAVERGAYTVAESAAEQEIEEVGRLGNLPVRLVAGDFSNLDCMAIGIQRALRYVGTNYTEDISLGQLARESFMSQSHLSFLLKRSLGVPFKSLLAAVRIERAKQLLSEANPNSITDISLEVGFGDLSHFERTFKRLVGTNPREYRRQQIVSRTEPKHALHAMAEREAQPSFSRVAK